MLCETEPFRALSAQCVVVTERLSTVQRPMRVFPSDTLRFALLIPHRHKIRSESGNETHSAMAEKRAVHEIGCSFFYRRAMTEMTHP